MVNSDLVALVNMHLSKRTVKLKAGAVRDDLSLELDVLVKDLKERKHLRLAVHQRQHIDGTGLLELGELIKLV